MRTFLEWKVRMNDKINNEWGYRMRREKDTQHDEQEKFMLHKFELIRHMFDEDY